MRRRLLLTLLATLILAPAALAAPAAAPSDGTLSVRNGDGAIGMGSFKGAVIGRIGQGTLEIEIPLEADCGALYVWGAENERDRFRTKADGATVSVCTFAGRNIRFRVIATRPQVLRVTRATDVDLSAVGTGYVRLKGRGGGPDGTFSLNGGDYRSLPDDGDTFVLDADA